MILRILFFLLLAGQTFGQQTIYDTITHNSLQRDYILYVPASYDGSQAFPLLFNFHGYTSNAFQQMWFGDFRPIADTADFLIVHPNGTLDAANNPHFNVGFGGSSVDDVGFTDALIDSLDALYNIDLNRVYSTGMSNGGFMSYHLACNLNDRIAAIASVTGSMTNLTFNNCTVNHPTPVMQIHGTADPTVPYQGSFGVIGIDAVMDYWSGINNVGVQPDSFSFPDINTTDGSTAIRISKDSGTCDSKTVLIKVFNGGHAWPFSFINLQGTNYDFNASVEVWNFLSQYSLSNLDCNSTSISETSSSELLRIYPNPANNFLIIEQETSKARPFRIIDLLGQVIKSGSIENTNFQIDLSNLANGTYVLEIEGKIVKFIKA